MEATAKRYHGRMLMWICSGGAANERSPCIARETHGSTEGAVQRSNILISTVFFFFFFRIAKLPFRSRWIKLWWLGSLKAVEMCQVGIELWAVAYRNNKSKDPSPRSPGCLAFSGPGCAWCALKYPRHLELVKSRPNTQDCITGFFFIDGLPNVQRTK